jgi:aminoglycoside phosphotransferase (APT) family kinase protein
MSNLKQEKVRDVLKKIFKTDKISEFTILPSYVNTVYLFEVNNEKFVIKIMTLPITSEWERYRLEKEAKLMEIFTEYRKMKKTKDSILVPTPESYYIGNDESLLGYRFIIYRYVEGEILYLNWNNLSKDNKISIAKEYGQIFRDIHKVKYDWYGEIEDCDSVTRHTDYNESVFAYLYKCTKKIRELNKIPEELIKQVEKYVEDNITKVGFKPEPVLVHNDLHHANTIVAKNNDGKYQIVAIVDWEWACADNPIIDLFYFRDMVLEDKDLEEAFFNEYFIGERLTLDEFTMDYKIYNLFMALDDIAFGGTFFNPTEENINNAINLIKENLK